MIAARPYKRKAFDPTHEFQLGFFNHEYGSRPYTWFGPVDMHASHVNMYAISPHTLMWAYYAGAYDVSLKRFTNRDGHDKTPLLMLTTKAEVEEYKNVRTESSYHTYRLWIKTVPETVTILRKIMKGDATALRVFCDFLHDDNKKHEWDLLPFEFRDTFFRMFCSDYAECVKREIAQKGKEL
jgi:hypothetical protein